MAISLSTESIRFFDDPCCIMLTVLHLLRYNGRFFTMKSDETRYSERDAGWTYFFPMDHFTMASHSSFSTLRGASAR